MYDAAHSIAVPAVARRAAVNSLLPLRVRGLRFEAGGKRIIDDIDFTLASPGITAIMGANGSGKSVLVRLLHGLLQPTQGKVFWNALLPDDTTRKRQALVLQRPILLRRSVAANLSFALALRAFSDNARRLADALAFAGLEHLARQPARVLSGGEQQRLALARALALEPEVLFLDEPTASLDPASVLGIEALISAARARGVKVILITHDLGQARRLADDIVFLHRGKLAEYGPAAPFWKCPASEPALAYVEGRIVL